MKLRPITKHQFSVFRLIFASGLFFLFAFAVGSPGRGRDSVLALNGEIFFAAQYFPNLLTPFSEIQWVRPAFALLMAVLSLFLLAGFHRRILSFFLWYGYNCTALTEPLQPHPSFAFFNFIFLSMIVIKVGEPWSRTAEQTEWQFPEKIYSILWIIFSVFISIEGFQKLHVTSEFGALNVIALLKVSALPMLFFSGFKKWLWLALLSTSTLELASNQITCSEFLGLFLMQLLIFDSRWLPPKTGNDEGSILFFDGVCSLCSGFIDFLFKEDQARLYKVAALQGQTASKLLPAERIRDLNTLVVLEDGHEKTKSQAVLTIFDRIGGIWRVVSYGRILPISFRNKLYDLVASSRYSLFGKKSSCRIPTAEEKALFLD